LRDLIFTKIINNWEAQDIPQHLKTIQDRLLIKDDQMIKRLGLYEKILETGAVVWDSTPEYLQLQLAGIVVKNGNKLVIANQIYRQIFPLDWVKDELAKIPPYAENLGLWMSSDQQNKTALLQDEDLEIALAWAKDKNLRNIDFQYLTASQNFALETQHQNLKRARWETKFVELQVNNAKKKASFLVKVGSLILALSLILSGLSSWLSYHQLKRAKISQEIEENSTDALLLAMFKNTENQQSILDALPPAILAGAKLDNLVNQQTPIDQYPATRPLLALQIILDHLHNNPQFSQQFPTDQKQKQLIGHQGAVTSLNFSQDGQFLVSGGIDDQIILWNLQGEKIRQWSAQQKAVKHVLFSQDSQYILTVGDLNSIKVWDLTGKKMTELTINLGPISSVSLSDRYLAIASLTGEIWLGDMVRKNDQVEIKPVSIIKNQELIKRINFNQNGEILATLDGKSNLQLSNLSKLASYKTSKQLAESIVSMTFSPTDTNILLTANTNGLMQFWQINNSKLVNQFATLYLDTRLIKLSHDSAYLATVGIDRRVRLWNLSGRQVAQYEFAENLIDLDFHSQQQLLAIAGSEGKIFLRSVKTLSELLTEACTFFQNTPERSPQVLKVCKDYQKN
ncbi:MAG: WD40 repeat domain-containing protein, partial [Microcoleaceae cyanobacterium]